MAPAVRWALQTKEVRFSYGRRKVLRDLSLEVPEGSVFGFLGRNGAGKTTAIRILMGILRPDHGWIDLNGTRVARVTASMRRQIGYVSQEQHFYEWMRVEQLGQFVRGFYPSWRDDEFERLLSAMHIERRQKVGELSGGTKAKLAISLALAHSPPILLLDEPTAGIDPITRREVLNVIREQARTQKRTILYSTHNIHDLESTADRVGILHGGRLVYQGEVKAIQDYFQCSPQPFPEEIPSYELGDGRFIGYARPEVWYALGIDTTRASLDDIFFAITRELG